MAIYCWKRENSTDLTKVILHPDVQLLPSTCELTAELNGTWQLNLTHIVSNDRRFEFIEPGGLLQVPSFNGSQYFRITQTVFMNPYLQGCKTILIYSKIRFFIRFW